jgi:predicted acyltransferase
MEQNLKETQAAVTSPVPGGRIEALDQFRGFAIVAMTAGNFLAGVRAVPAWLKHAPDAGLTVADLIAPFFIFAIALTYGRSFAKRAERDGFKGAYEHFAKRFFTLMALGFIMSLGAVWTGETTNPVNWGVLQAIGLAGLVTLTVIRFPWWAKLAVGLAGLAVYQLLVALLLGDAILGFPHGGVPGAFSWSCMMILGCGAADVFHRFKPQARNLAIMGAAFCAAGLVIALVVPVSKNRVSASYTLLATGLSLAVFLGFFLLSGKAKVRIPLLSEWGMNPLLLYLLGQIVLAAWVFPPADWWYGGAPLWLAALQLTLMLAAMSAFALFLAKKKFVVSL